MDYIETTDTGVAWKYGPQSSGSTTMYLGNGGSYLAGSNSGLSINSNGSRVTSYTDHHLVISRSNYYITCSNNGTFSASTNSNNAANVILFEKRTVITYAIKFIGANGAVLETDELARGDMPEYHGATPVKADDEDYTYTFMGWSPELAKVTGLANYTAVFDAVPKETGCVVSFYEEDGETLIDTRTVNKNTEWSEFDKPEAPAKTCYVFNTWLNAPEIVTEDVNVVASYTANHNLTEHAAVLATCSTPGNNLYYSCGTCGKYFSDAQGTTEIAEDSWVIPATGQHVWGDPVWTWAADHRSATAKFTCSSGGESEEVADTEIETSTSGDIMTFTASVTHNGTVFTDSQNVTMPVRVKSATVSLKDSIIIKFSLVLNEAGRQSDYTVVYSIRNKETRAVLGTLDTDSSGRYQVWVPVVAKEMTEPVDIWVVDKNGNIVSNQVTYSVETYCLNKIKNTSNAKDLRDLCAAILNYGAYAQIHLNHNTGALANRSLAQYNYSTAVPSVTIPESDVVQNGSTSGFTIKSATLSLKEATVLKFTFTIAEGASINDYKIVCSGKTLTPESVGNNQYQVSITGIAAKNLDNMYTVKVTKNGSGNYSVKYGPLTYLYRHKDDTADGLGNLCKAMYYYHQQAKSYFANNAN